ncbi:MULTISPECIES: LysR substrate-binding domain-containing protein [Bordetella]|nr:MULTISPECIES: LysR substrate-binding domain-containing protein [Bordetella]
MNTTRMQRMPPLNALRSFESAARHESFLKAAAELHVTPGAVSRLVKSLESYLGVELFMRSHRGVAITPQGKAFAEDILEAFNKIGVATDRVQQHLGDRGLSICCHPTFAAHWLTPRWAQVQAALPSTQINVKTTLAPELESTDDYDFVVKLGPDPAAEQACSGGVAAERVLDVETFPICSSAFLQRHGGELGLDDIERYPLIHAQLRPQDWNRWLQSVGQPALRQAPGLVFESLTLAYNAAMSGAGVAIGIHAFIADDIASGRLVAPFPHVRKSHMGFNIYFNAQRAARVPRIEQIRRWMVQERNKTRATDTAEALRKSAFAE